MCQHANRARTGVFSTWLMYMTAYMQSPITWALGFLCEEDWSEVLGFWEDFEEDDLLAEALVLGASALVGGGLDCVIAWRDFWMSREGGEVNLDFAV